MRAPGWHTKPDATTAAGWTANPGRYAIYLGNTAGPVAYTRGGKGKLTHVVLDADDAGACGDAVEKALGFRVSDRTKGMVFVRCNESHHSTAFLAQASPLSTISRSRWKTSML